jgi:hypothetical protein
MEFIPWKVVLRCPFQILNQIKKISQTNQEVDIMIVEITSGKKHKTQTSKFALGTSTSSANQ